MNTIAITTTSFGEYSSEPLDLLKEKSFKVLLNPYRRKLEKSEIVEFCKDSAGIIAGTELLNSEVLDKLVNLKVISRCGTGLDNVDLEGAERLGIKVYNTPDAPTKAVSELTVGLILSCLRHIPRNDKNIRAGKWNKPMGELLEGKVVGIIGFGRIGRMVSRFIKAFGADVIACDVITPLENCEIQMVTFDKLISDSDIISLHLSPNKDTGCIIDEKAILKMKKGAYLINTSRGGLVDENTLYNALKSGKLSGAALDTFVKEPYTGKLGELDNVIMTAHIGSYARQSRVDMEKQAVENLLDGLKKADLI